MQSNVLNRDKVVRVYSDSSPIYFNFIFAFFDNNVIFMYMKSTIIQDILDKIELSINSGIFENVETEIVELKDLSSGNEWKSLKQTINAFLNTHDGIIITGIRERDNKYFYTGYKENNLQNYLNLKNEFTDDEGKQLDLSDNIAFEIKNFLEKQIKIIYVQSVSEDIKYIFYKGDAFERKSTADIKVTKEKIEAHKQYKKEELPLRKEILPIKDAKIDDLDLSKLNDYIQFLNKEVKVQNLIPENDYEGAKTFLTKKYFIKDDYVTTLGMLVCGKDPSHFLEFRCEVDCFVNASLDVAKNKKVINGTVIYLMEESYRFVFNNIQVGVGIKNSGSKIPEYPERVIRESLNNALAHREYNINKNVNISIKPNKEIELKNPGSFKSNLLINVDDYDFPIRRIIPGNPSTKNPKLASILKIFDKWEGKGYGMATLVNICLDNEIDLPYYKMTSDEISLVIPKGRLLDDRIEFWLKSYENYIIIKLGIPVTQQQKLVLAYLYKSELLNQQYRYTILLTTDNDYFDALNTLFKAKLIFKHNKSSNLYPIYLVNRDLARTDFLEELRSLYDHNFELLAPYYKKILNVIYRYSKYNNKSVTAKAVADELFIEEEKTINNKTRYTTFVRKISNYCNKMASNERNLLVREKGYKINFNFSNKESLFN